MLSPLITINEIAYNSTYLLFGSFQEPRVHAWLSLVFCSGSHLKMPTRAGVSPEAQGPLPSSLVIGRIQSLGAVEPVATCFSKASRRIFLLSKG